MTASRSRLARLALVAAALSIAVFGALGARREQPGNAPGHGSLLKDTVVVATQAVAERPSRVDPAAPRLLWVAVVGVALAALGWARVRPGVADRRTIVTALTWRRRGPPAFFLS